MVKLDELKQLPYIVYSIEVDGEKVSFVVESNSPQSSMFAEAQHRGVPIGGPYSAVHHGAHIDPGQDHLHVYCKNNMIFAMNNDGSAHDRSHGTPIPNRVVDGIRKHFPEFTIPPNNFIESAPAEVLTMFFEQLNG